MKNEPTNSNTSDLVPEAPTNKDEAEGKKSSIVDYLEELYERAQDAREGYKKAAQLTESARLRKVFEENSVQRTEFALELEGLLRTMGEEPEADSCFYGKLHQGWMQIVSKFSEGEDVLLSECQRGEEAALKSYSSALDTMKLPDSVVGTVERQRDRIRHELITLRNFEKLETAKF